MPNVGLQYLVQEHVPHSLHRGRCGNAHQKGEMAPECISKTAPSPAITFSQLSQPSLPECPICFTKQPSDRLQCRQAHAKSSLEERGSNSECTENTTLAQQHSGALCQGRAESINGHAAFSCQSTDVLMIIGCTAISIHSTLHQVEKLEKSTTASEYHLGMGSFTDKGV